MQPERVRKALCPKCGQFGFVSQRWVTSSYYPKHCSIKCILLEAAEGSLSADPSSKQKKQRVNYLRQNVRGDEKEYRGRSKKHLEGYEYSEAANIKDKKSLIRVTYGKYAPFYIGHYDKEKYKEQMDSYRRGIIKSRPNGRRWCKLPTCFYKYRIVDSPNGKYMKFVKLYPRSITKIFM